MSNPALEKLVWVLIYSGLLFVFLGVFLLRHDTVLGWVIIVAGAVDAAAGVVLNRVRSRRKN